MATRPTWQGHLRLSLVSCPVALYTATSRSGEVHFNMLHKETHNRIRMIPTDPELGPVERSDIVKGYEYEKGHYVVVTPEEIENVRLETTRTIDIERFVDESEIDRLYWNDPYFLAPDGKMAVEAFAVIREAMEKAGKVALGRVVMHQRERLLALEPRGEGLLAYTLRNNREVRSPKEVFDVIPDVKPDAKMVEIAAKIIEQLEGPFDPSEFNDRYEDALRALIKEKEAGKGRKVTAPEQPEAEVIDLMEALRRSLGQAGGGERRAKTPRKRATASKTKPAAKKPAAKKRA
jgi:DNA end-binding protein Ku